MPELIRLLQVTAIGARRRNAFQRATTQPGAESRSPTSPVAANPYGPEDSSHMPSGVKKTRDVAHNLSPKYSPGMPAQRCSPASSQKAS